MNLIQHLLLLTSLAFTLPVTDKEKELLPVWPETGPQLLFEIDGLGNGYSSPVIKDNNIYVTGETDSMGFLFAYDFKGKLQWKASYGKSWTVCFPGSRATPTIIDELIYTCSGFGEITCFNRLTGEKKWFRDPIRELSGENASYGYGMPLVFSGDTLFFSAGGKVNNIIAMNRFSGMLIWSSPAMGEIPAYGPPLLIQLPKCRLLVTSSEYNILGLDAETGKLLWSYELAFKGEIPCNTPVYDGNNLYWTAGPGNGAVAVKLSPDGRKYDVIWKNPEFDTYFGDFVKIGDYLYGSSNSLRKYISINARTGKTMQDLPFGIGSTILSDNMIIAYNQQGQVGLIRPSNDKMELISSFKISRGTNEHFSHPVVSDGRLFIRHGNALLVYTISQ